MDAAGFAAAIVFGVEGFALAGLVTLRFSGAGAATVFATILGRFFTGSTTVFGAIANDAFAAFAVAATAGADTTGAAFVEAAADAIFTG